jgi:DNA polymerase
VTSLGCIATLVQNGLEFGVDGEHLVVQVSAESESSGVPDDLVQALQEKKPELVAQIGAWQGVTFIDFETRAPVSITEIGAHNYIAHPEFEVIGMVATLPDGATISWTPAEPPPARLFEATTGATVAAHNAHGFDRLVWERLGWPAPAAWLDTLQIARLAGLPGALDALGHELLGLGKDAEGKKVMMGASRIDRSTGRLPVLDAPSTARIMAYCRQDVAVLRGVAIGSLSAFAGGEPAVRQVDQTINDRGFLFDRDLAEAAIHLEHELAADAQRNAPVDGTVLRSHAKLKKYLHSAGIEVHDVRRGSLEVVLDDPDLAPDVRAVVSARLLSSGITGTKLSAGVRMQSPDGRIRGAFVYHAARTGRWSAKGLQPQNLPRGAKLDPGQIESLMEVVRAGGLERLRAFGENVGHTPTDLLATIVRSCICASPGTMLGVVDYAQIEARALLWLAGDDAGLQPYLAGDDPYRVQAALLLGKDPAEVTPLERTLGKVMVLGCGFGIGALRFGNYGEAMGVDWSSVGLSPEAAVDAWRDAHPAIAGWATGDYFNGRPCRTGGLWKDLEHAAIRVVRYGGSEEVGRCHWTRQEGDLHCLLPSGRTMVYRAPQLRTRGGGNRLELTYMHRRTRVPTWGGKLAENITQAACRDLLAGALVGLESRGLRPVLHVHDEVVCELVSEDQVQEMVAICETLPRWATGLPVRAEAYATDRYRK